MELNNLDQLSERIKAGKIAKHTKTVKDSLKVFTPIGAITGFVSDVITPILPIIDYLAIGLLGATLVLSTLYYKKHKSAIEIKLAAFLPNSIILTVIIGGFSLLGLNSPNGFFAENIDSVASLQQSLFNIEQGVQRVEQKVDNMQEDISVIKESVTTKVSDIDTRLSQIEKQISDGTLVSNPSTLEEFLINAMVHYNMGNFKEAEIMFEKVFNEGYLKYDLAQIYYEVLLNNYNVDYDRIHILLKDKPFTKNTLFFSLAELEANNSGIKYYKEIEKITIEDSVLKSFVENIKSKSFYIDVQKYASKIDELMCYWTPKFLENKEVLGLKIMRSRKLFFNYVLAYKKYLENTSYSSDENAVFDFYNTSGARPNCNSKAAKAAWLNFKL